jgi:hypothetical protein
MVLRDLYRLLRRLLPPQPQGLYEILAYDTTLELLDTKGECARFCKRQRVKFAGT